MCISRVGFLFILTLDKALTVSIAVDWDGVGATYYTPPPEGFGPDTWKV